MKCLYIFSLLTALFFLMAGCGTESEVINESEETKTGTIVLDLDDSEMALKIFEPDVSMEIVRYRIVGDLIHPTGKPPKFHFDSFFDVGEDIKIEDLAWGFWRIRVQAYNEEEVLIGAGCRVVFLGVLCTTPLCIIVKPIRGYGDFYLNIDWPEEDTLRPLLEGELIPARNMYNLCECEDDEEAVIMQQQVPNRELEFMYGPHHPHLGVGEASTMEEHLFRGYYTVVVRLYDQCLECEERRKGEEEIDTKCKPICEDKKELLMGAAEIVRIVAGYDTYGEFIFEEINRMGVDLDINIFQAMQDPLDVFLSPFGDQCLEENTEVEADVTNAGMAGLVYYWFINGEFKGNGTGDGSTFDLPNDMVGVFRLDVIVYTANGRRAGSATQNYHVTDCMSR